MECPKCGVEIDNNTLVCPNCKKVLKIICPTCRTINTKNICKTCGEILASKCVKCGKINLTRNKNCPKCGYPTAYSALQGECLTDEFAVIKIEFPNSDIVKAKLGSNKLFTKFRSNFDRMIVKYVNSLGLRRQVFKGDVYIIRFNRTYTFSSSANDAMKAVVELANMLARLNVKLLNRINTILKCNITIMKKEASSDPYDINSGFRANMLGQGVEVADKALDSIQVITDDDFYELYNLDYKLEGLDSAPVNGIMKRFYEIDLKDFIHIDEFIEEDTISQDEVEEIPEFVQNAIENQDELARNINNKVTEQDLYNIDLINFEEVNCTFYSTENIAILDKIKEVLKNVPKGITAIKGSEILQPYTVKLLSAVNDTGIYQNIIPITCYDDMKYNPYSFFRDLISTIFEFCISQKLFDENDFSMFNSTNSEDFVKDLVNLNQRDMNDIYESRSRYFQVFLDLFNAIPNTLIYIENFEKIDSSSLFILEQLFEHFNDLNVSYLVSYDKNFSLHQSAHFLLMAPYYTEINLIPASFNNIVSEDYEFYKNVVNDFYFRKVEKYVNGSVLFLDFAIQYLIESGIYSVKDDKLQMVAPKTAIIPSTVGRLIQRRLNLIKNKNIIKFLTMSVLMGTRIDIKTVELFGFENWRDIADKLSERGFLYIYNNCIYFSNYNLLKENLLSIIPPKDLSEIANELLQRVFIESIASPIKAFLYEITDNHEKVIFEWEKLANINLSMGDFSSYINCSEKILDLLNKYSPDWSEQDLEKYKNVLYENISANMLDYNPESSREIAQQALNSLKNRDNIKFIQFCIKMIQGCCAHGEFVSAQNLTHKLLSLMGEASINPEASNFDFNYLYIFLLHIKVLFNIGKYNECISIGYSILNVLDSKKISNLNFDQSFKDELTYLILEDITCIALANIILLKDDVQEFIKITSALFNFVPEEFSIFVQLQNLIRGQSVELADNIERKNLITDVIYHIIKAFTDYKDNPEDFAREIYKVKISAKYSYMANFELFADLMIGYSYIRLKSYKKAQSIITRVEQTAKNKGMFAIVYVSLYLLSILSIKQKKYDIALGILSNSDIQMEKTPISDYFVLLNKVNMYIVLMCQGNEVQADICLNQAKYIIQKYNVNFDLNIDIGQILGEN